MLPQDSGIKVESMYGHPAQEVLPVWVNLDEFIMGRFEVARDLKKG